LEPREEEWTKQLPSLEIKVVFLGSAFLDNILYFSCKGCAKLIEFNPLRDTSMKLPKNAVFVISHSLAEMNKAATADFNCRVVECRIACQVRNILFFLSSTPTILPVIKNTHALIKRRRHIKYK